MAAAFSEPWLGWAAQLGAPAALTSRLIVDLTIESGYVLVPMAGRVKGERAVAAEGVWLGGFLTLGARI